MRRGNARTNRKAHSHAVLLFRIERFEYARDSVWRDARPLIIETNLKRTLARSDGDGERTPPFHGLQRVLAQIYKHLLDLRGISRYPAGLLRQDTLNHTRSVLPILVR